MNIQIHLTWIIPLVITILSAMFLFHSQFETMKVRLNEIEHRQNTDGIQSIKKLDDIDHRLKIVERFCCSEVIEPKPILTE